VDRLRRCNNVLLIAPEGIEIRYGAFAAVGMPLLIAPEGIEITISRR
jgi:hypothetical protein